MKKVATLEEVQKYYDLVEVIDLHELLNIQDDVEYLEAEKLKRETGKSR